jgi:imidazolonepropionase
LQATSEDDLFDQSKKRLEEVMNLGTGAIEIKSGYGLTVEDELKMLRVIKRLKEEYPIPVKSTFLGAHAFPADYKNDHNGYVDLIIDEMIPRVAEEKLADYIDVFCDRGFFTPEETERILIAGEKVGLPAKIHANELDYSGGIQVGVKHRARSVDHLEFTGEDEIQTLLASETMPTLLPSTAFYLNLEFPPARKMIDAGLPVALASDYNPGSSPSGRMAFVISLACIKMKMLPAEAINAATVNGAYAMGLENEVGSITRGKRANLIITKSVSNYEYIPYAFGSDLIENVLINGRILK